MDEESKKMELAAIRGHEEARERLLEIRSDYIVNRLEQICTEYEFATVVADDIKKHRKIKRLEQDVENGWYVNE